MMCGSEGGSAKGLESGNLLGLLLLGCQAGGGSGGDELDSAEMVKVGVRGVEYS